METLLFSPNRIFSLNFGVETLIVLGPSPHLYICLLFSWVGGVVDTGVGRFPGPGVVEPRAGEGNRYGGQQGGGGGCLAGVGLGWVKNTLRNVVYFEVIESV